MITISAIRHVPLSEDAALSFGQTLEIRLRTRAGEPLEVSLFYGDRVSMTDPIPVTQVKMKRIGCDGVSDIYGTCVHSPYTRFCYYFRICEKEGAGDPLVIYYSEHGFDPEPTADRTQFFQYPYLRREDLPGAPVWGKDTLLYHIFPDSFADQKAGISDRSFEVTGEDGQTSRAKHGGTLRGVTENLPYIRDLGMNCIYLNPIFRSASCHKYDTIDYFAIDPCLGTKEDLVDLVKKAHELGIRVILDGVFNHSGSGFAPFLDVLEKGEASDNTSWFYHLSFPVKFEDPPNYEAFAYVKEMPKLNTSDPKVRDYCCEVGRYWIREAGIDGWRLDVANEVDHDFWRAFRKAVREEREDALLIAEIWEDATCWLQGDQFDSSMNYQFADICRDFFAKGSITADAFDQRINRMYFRYSESTAAVQMNFLDTHDVPRFLEYCGGDQKKMAVAAAFLLLFPGIPSVFYGDELGVRGGTEETYRQIMPWKEEKGALYKVYRDLARLRQQYEILRRGNFRSIWTDERFLQMSRDLEQRSGVYGFFRTWNGQKVLILINTEKERFTLHYPEGVTAALLYGPSGEQLGGGSFSVIEID